MIVQILKFLSKRVKRRSIGGADQDQKLLEKEDQGLDQDREIKEDTEADPEHDPEHDPVKEEEVEVEIGGEAEVMIEEGEAETEEVKVERSKEAEAKVIDEVERDLNQDLTAQQDLPL